ncbi:histidine phosphatase family protein [Rhizobiaceae bacterium n13]|uniref:Histidine phosphatase family protein n=1 Tax=Ferirhizobium litorale TaxID=2927786 RepID=A0AAE3QGV7_9HYPH|nr:histidine phosphatase family protein [Fererhizobium litorale]MDI7862398.1 histidine phosphatase family protein [Fererhizobium litorale]MDI7923715.1 histidine phosphatase family protein [Fererhizobium litorale]
MRRILFLRHAKSARPEGVADHDRPLAPRGNRAAPLIGSYMASNGLIPDLVLVSTALRTRQTWELVRKELPQAVPERDEPGLYEASAQKMVIFIRATNPAVHTLMLVGHNPGTEDAARLITGGGEPDALSRLSQKYPTAGLAVVAFDIERWRDVAPLEGYLERFVTPDMLD